MVRESFISLLFYLFLVESVCAYVRDREKEKSTLNSIWSLWSLPSSLSESWAGVAHLVCLGLTGLGVRTHGWLLGLTEAEYVTNCASEAGPSEGILNSCGQCLTVKGRDFRNTIIVSPCIRRVCFRRGVYLYALPQGMYQS